LSNGGRRCWVVRTADHEMARSNLFPMPGLMQARIYEDGRVDLRPAFAQARSEGRWSDSVRMGAALIVQPVVLQASPVSAPGGALALLGAGVVRPGDLLRLRYTKAGLTALLAVDTAAPSGAALRMSGRALWFAQVVGADSPGPATSVTLYNDPKGRAATLVRPVEINQDGSIRIVLPLKLPDAPPPGALLRIDSAEPIWMLVQDAHEYTGEAPEQPAIEVVGTGLRCLSMPPDLPAEMPLCERLTLELHARVGDADPLRLGELDFVPGAPRFWGALPSDAQLFDADESELRERHAELWRAASAPRFPVAGGEQPAGFTFPFEMQLFPEYFLRPAIPEGSALQRDGLEHFAAGLFLDDSLDDALTAELMSRADYIRYLAREPRKLRGIHAALAIEEATLIAVPDAAHRGWEEVLAEGMPPAKALDPLLRPSWWHFQGCDPVVKPVREPEWGNFLDCSIAIIAPPELTSDSPDASGTFTLAWTTPAPDAVAILEEATRPDFSDAVEIYQGTDTHLTLYGRSPGEYYYHVRVVVEPNTSDWSAGWPVRVGEGGGWRVRSLVRGFSFELLAVHRALLRLCAARGDLFAVLSLPEHFREDDAIAHVAALRPSAIPIFGPGDNTPPLGFGEALALSYSALYHPWLIGRENGQQLRRTPPDGTVCGMMARRALARGAWVAPANERLSGVVALTPPIERRRWLDLQSAQVNLIRNEPYGFVTLSADTLSSDPDLLAVNVRRLLILLRRLALRMGAGFVFEPNDDLFRRLVQRELEAVLTDLFARGAFAGDQPDNAYQVVLSGLPQDIDAGRLIVDIKIAPSLPMTFLTIRLVQTGGRSVVTEER
jgi:hypothetical protein